MSTAKRRTASNNAAPRARNAEATRAAILASARRAFAAKGYDGAGVREIAAGAGVTAMLVNRYFGSKQGLFAEVLAETMRAPIILADANITSATPAKDMAAALVRITKGPTPLDGILISLHSASSKQAAKIGKKQIEAHHQRDLAAILKGKLAPQRAAIVLSLVMGFVVMRQVIGLSALTQSKPDELESLLTPLLKQLLDAKA